jgi:hypothetical protein
MLMTEQLAQDSLQNTIKIDRFISKTNLPQEVPDQYLLQL